MELNEIRQHLDRLDNTILALLAERLSYSEKVAEQKQTQQLPIYQPEREQEIIDQKKDIAKKHSLNPEFAKDIFKKIIDESSRIQREHLK